MLSIQKDFFNAKKYERRVKFRKKISDRCVSHSFIHESKQKTSDYQRVIFFYKIKTLRARNNDKFNAIFLFQLFMNLTKTLI